MHLKRQDLPRTGVVHGFAGSLQQAQRDSPDVVRLLFRSFFPRGFVA
jgi:Tat protein secretion system quality control protein TatD with DNase activity